MMLRHALKLPKSSSPVSIRTRNQTLAKGGGGLVSEGHREKYLAEMNGIGCDDQSCHIPICIEIHDYQKLENMNACPQLMNPLSSNGRSHGRLFG